MPLTNIYLVSKFNVEKTWKKTTSLTSGGADSNITSKKAKLKHKFKTCKNLCRLDSIHFEMNEKPLFDVDSITDELTNIQGQL